LTKGFSPKATGTKAGTNFSPQAIGTTACTRLSGLGTELSPRQPRVWWGAYLPASLGPDWCFSLSDSLLVLEMISFLIYVYLLLSLYDRQFNHHHLSLL